MKKNILFLQILVLFTIVFFSCNNTTLENSIDFEIIADTNYTNGVGLNGTSSSNRDISKVIYPFEKSENKHDWMLAQWGCKQDLKDATIEMTDNGKTYSDPGKSIAFKAVDGSTQITMTMLGSKQYPEPRKSGEDWLHLLLEQHFSNPKSLKEFEKIDFNIDFKILFSEMKMSNELFDPKLHSTQFTIYLTIQNMNKNSDKYGDFIWFGLPLYDYRYDVIKEYAAQDLGKEDATKKFIFSTESKSLYDGIAKDGQWINVSKDILGIIQRALSLAHQRGFLKGSEYNDMYVTTTNIGWETPGTFDCAIQYKNLKLVATLKK